jgi:hypothetical protein
MGKQKREQNMTEVCRNNNLLRYTYENRSSLRAVTGKWLWKNYKLTTRLKNKMWTIPQTKTI